MIASLLAALAASAYMFTGNPTGSAKSQAGLAKAQQAQASTSTESEERGVKDSAMTPEEIEQAKENLSSEQYNVCVMGGTEQPFNNKYYDHHEDGTYHCAVCGIELFSSDTKYDSGSGWPAFYDAVDKGKTRELRDTSHGLIRTEVRCGNCDAHLGHLFNDGPSPTGMRYCINSASLEFEDADDAGTDQPENPSAESEE